MLTDVECKKITAGEKDIKLSDAKGLFLLVKKTGGKYWRLAYRFAGKQKLLALGTYPETTLTKAREAREVARALLTQGTDPSEQRRSDNLERKIRASSTFEQVAREWHATKAGEWVPAYATKVLDSLIADIFPTLGHRPVTEITSAELLGTLRKIEARGALETLKRVRQRVSDVFLYAIATGRTENNPAEGLHKALKVQKAKHRAALHPRDLRDFFIRLEVGPVSKPVKLALRLLALTFVRPAELRGARWCELDLNGAEWVIPAERDRSRGLVGMKMRREHRVPLSGQAVAIFRELQEISGNEDLVFPNRNNHERPISDGTLNSALRALGYEAREVTGHGFRATATGGLLELGFKPEVIDRQLAHRERNEVFGAYSHQVEYLAERRQLMDAWADYVDSLVAGGNVVPLNRAA